MFSRETSKKRPVELQEHLRGQVLEESHSLSRMFVPIVLLHVARLPWHRPSPVAPPLPPPGPNYIVLPFTFETLLAVLVCWVLPVVIWTFTQAHNPADASADGKRTATTGTGQAVVMDIERRKAAVSADPIEKKGADRKLQLLMWVYFLVPYVWAWNTQENPTVREQVSTWMAQSWAQLADGQVTLHFQLAFLALLSERLCYTWVHTFSQSFVRFHKTKFGQMLGKEPLDAVLNLFYVNKTFQLGTFLTCARSAAAAAPACERAIASSVPRASAVASRGGCQSELAFRTPLASNLVSLSARPPPLSLSLPWQLLLVRGQLEQSLLGWLLRAPGRMLTIPMGEPGARDAPRPGPQHRHLPRHRQGGRLLRLPAGRARALGDRLPLLRLPTPSVLWRVRVRHGRQHLLCDCAARKGGLVQPDDAAGAALHLHGARRGLHVSGAGHRRRHYIRAL